jgi:hypothetical protein
MEGVSKPGPGLEPATSFHTLQALIADKGAVYQPRGRSQAARVIGPLAREIKNPDPGPGVETWSPGCAENAAEIRALIGCVGRTRNNAAEVVHANSRMARPWASAGARNLTTRRPGLPIALTKLSWPMKSMHFTFPYSSIRSILRNSPGGTC